jgi:hypothetical protein
VLHFEADEEEKIFNINVVLRVSISFSFSSYRGSSPIRGPPIGARYPAGSLDE